MAFDCGWVELVSLDAGGTVARAHLFVHGMPLPSEPWRGHLDSVHLAQGVTDLPPQQYLLRFAHGLQDMRVYVEVGDRTVLVRGEDALLPIPLTELSEGE